MTGLQRVCPGGRARRGTAGVPAEYEGRGRIETGGVILNIEMILSQVDAFFEENRGQEAEKLMR